MIKYHREPPSAHCLVTDQYNSPFLCKVKVNDFVACCLIFNCRSQTSYAWCHQSQTGAPCKTSVDEV